jgi:catechol 2,3-dioxygenase-like lactoylglutathione lyase family enzyme
MKLGAVVLDSDDAEKLSDFYRDLLGWEKIRPEADWIVVYDKDGDGTALTFEEIDDYERPVWPWEKHKQQQMLHLDFYLKPGEPEGAVEHALRCGAKKSEVQFTDDWVVMLDPAGHPFCLIPFVKPQ